MNLLSLRHSLQGVLLLTAAVALSGCVSTGGSSNDPGTGIFFSHSDPVSERRDLNEQSKALAVRRATSDGLRSVSQITLHFDNDSAVVRRDDIERLQSFILSFDSLKLPVFLITGHTDSVHSDEYNILLSDMRAKATQSQMLRLGIPITQTAIRGLGESYPIATNSSKEGRQSNRRVSVQAIQ